MPSRRAEPGCNSCWPPTAAVGGRARSVDATPAPGRRGVCTPPRVQPALTCPRKLLVLQGNFVLIYELLDEVLDHGYPQVGV